MPLEVCTNAPILEPSVAVGVFKVVIELEVKRRDNDKKVNLLFLEMKKMMSALLQYVHGVFVPSMNP